MCRRHRSCSSPCILMRVSASSAPKGSSSKQQFGLANQGAGQRDPLGLATGQRARPHLGLVGQVHLVERVERLSAAPPTVAGKPMVTLRSTRCQGSSRGSWNTMARRSGTRRTPSTSPSSAPSARRNVLLPEPLRPSSATNSPRADLAGRARRERRCRRTPFGGRRATTTVSVGASVTVIGSSPGQQPGLEEADDEDASSRPSAA